MEIKDLEIIVEEAKKAYQRGKYNDAAEGFHLAVTSYQAQNNQLMAAEMANNQSVSLLQAGKAKPALEAVIGTEKIFKQAGDNLKQAMAIGNRGAALEALNRLNEAETAYLKSAELLKDSGESDLHGFVMQSLSAVQLRKGKQLEAIANMQAGLDGIENPSLNQRILQKLLKLPFKFIGR
jgi:tetratricopeptide (TPR) repeat protein